MQANLDAAAVQGMELVATVLFALAVVHTFLVQRFQNLAHRFEEGSITCNMLEFLGEVEVVFGLWAAVLFSIWSVRYGVDSAVAYVDGVNYTEAVFVFVIMCMAATRPVIFYAGRLISLLARALPLPRALAEFAAIFVVGPLLGSFITEPAAMTVTALLVSERFFACGLSHRFRYAALGLLFVNISIGGTLTHFAAPPVIMVAGPWGWDLSYMAQHFGWRAVIAIVLGTGLTIVAFRRELTGLELPQDDASQGPPLWLAATHVAFIALAVAFAHYASFVLALFLMFVGWWTVTREHQDELKVRESLLVAFFLGGLVTLGNLQGWWITPLVETLAPLQLFWGATVLTAFTDNAALTYLGTLVPSLSETSRYALVAGAVVGGGLTVIANAPNPVGYGILQPRFGKDGISPLQLALAAVPYTLLAAALFLI